jgi:hypothetical protein
MAQVCPHCSAAVADESMQCSACGANLDPCRTIPPAGPKPRAATGSAGPDRSPVPQSRPSRPESPSPVAPLKPKARRAKPSQPSPSEPPPAAPAPATPPIAPGYPAPPPIPQIPPGHYYPPMYAPVAMPPAQPNPPAQGGVLGWMIKKFGKTGDPPAPPPPYPPPIAYPVYPPMPGQSDYFGPAPAPGATPASWPPYVPAPAPESSITPPASPPYERGDDDEGMTRGPEGLDLDKLKIPRFNYTLQILDNNGQWRDWEPIHANGKKVGRSKENADIQGLGSMAVRHMKFRYERGNVLVVEDLGSLNGVYLRTTSPVELTEGQRFRVGNQVIEFRHAGTFEPAAPLTSEDGEEFCSRDLMPLAYLDLIRPDGRPGLRFPITRETTVIGREGPSPQIALTGDNSVSATHAQVRLHGGSFVLEDLRSRNGTFVRVEGSCVVKTGDILLAGRVLFRVVDHAAG